MNPNNYPDEPTQIDIELAKMRNEIVRHVKRAFTSWESRWITTDRKVMAKNWARFYAFLKAEIGD